MAKTRIEQLYFVRSIACLCVVFVHSMTRVVEIHGPYLSENQELALMTIRLLFTFGTPIFIFLSEFLISYSYTDLIPENFLLKRVRYILLPYLSMGVLYALLMVHESGNGLSLNSLLSTFGFHLITNLFFGFYHHGYFIIVIFQFYLLHLWLHRFLDQNSPKWVLPASLAINLMYLAFFNLTPPPEVAYGEYLWRGLSWVPFPSWIFYFSLGFYTGKHYDSLKEKVLVMSGKRILLFPIMAGILVASLYIRGIITEDSSRRIDVLILSSSMIILLFRQAFKMQKLHVVFFLLNSFSFGIYLLHMVFLYGFTQLFEHYHALSIHPVLTLVILFGGSTLASMVATDIISRFKWGYRVIGKKPLYRLPLSQAKEKYST